VQAVPPADAFCDLCFDFEQTCSLYDYVFVLTLPDAILCRAHSFDLPLIVHILRETCFLPRLRSFIEFSKPLPESDQLSIQSALFAIDSCIWIWICICICSSVALAQEACNELVLVISRSVRHYCAEVRPTPRSASASSARFSASSRKLQARFYAAVLHGLYLLCKYEQQLLAEFPAILEKTLRMIEMCQAEVPVCSAPYIGMLHYASEIETESLCATARHTFEATWGM
jgi:hypothetical protein